VLNNKKRLRISDFIRHLPIDKNGLPIITTNYDRLIEVGCEIAGFNIDNMFVGKLISKLNEKESKMSFCRSIKQQGGKVSLDYCKRIRIYKPHGCFNWRMFNNEPMSLAIPIKGRRLIITPGLNKFRAGYEKPFDIHREKANSAIDMASKIIVIGYGFNDDHLETHLIEQIKLGKPTLILTRSLSDNTKAVVDIYKNVCALSYYKTNSTMGTKYENNGNTQILENINLWDIGELVKEVF
jgi:hypothetical protein